MKVNFSCDLSAFPDDAFPKHRYSNNQDNLPEKKKNNVWHLNADPSHLYLNLGQNHVSSLNEEAADVTQTMAALAGRAVRCIPRPTISTKWRVSAWRLHCWGFNCVQLQYTYKKSTAIYLHGVGKLVNSDVWRWRECSKANAHALWCSVV